MLHNMLYLGIIISEYVTHVNRRGIHALALVLEAWNKTEGGSHNCNSVPLLAIFQYRCTGNSALVVER
jgi:hypothetical protein